MLLTYPDGSAAAVARAYGKGQVVALGAHLECPPDLNEDSPPPVDCEKVLVKLLGI